MFRLKKLKEKKKRKNNVSSSSRKNKEKERSSLRSQFFEADLIGGFCKRKTLSRLEGFITTVFKYQTDQNSI